MSFTQNGLSEEQWFFDLVAHVQEHVENEKAKTEHAVAYWMQDPVFKARDYRPQITTGPDESENPNGVVHITVEHSKKRMKYGGGQTPRLQDARLARLYDSGAIWDQ